MKSVISLAFKNIRSYRKKSFAAILAIASGFIALNLFQSYIFDTTLLFQSTYVERSMYGDVLIRKTKRYETMNTTEQAAVDEFLKKHATDIENHSRQLYFTGTANSGQSQFFYVGVGYDIENGLALRGANWQRNTLYGRSLSIASAESEISIGEGFAYQLGCLPEKKIVVPIEKRGYHHAEVAFNCPFDRLQLSTATTTGQVNAFDVKVIGIQDGLFKEVDDRLVNTSLSLAQKLTNSNSISYYSVKLKAEDDLSHLKEAFDLEIGKQFPELKFDSWKNFDIGDFYQQTISFLTLFRNFFSIIVISIGMLSVMATFYRLIHERRKEIGILRSIGLKNSFIVQLFLIESFVLSVLGISIGIVVSAAFAGIVNQIAVPYSLGMLTQPVAFAMTMNPSVVLFSSLVTAIVSMTFSLMPVYRVMKLKVVDILRESN